MSDDKSRVLIVDDSPDDIHFVLENLKDEYAVIVATSGEQALEMVVAEARPDVVLMDVEMPGMNGYETCSLIKSSPDTADIPVIFLSAHDTIEQKLAGFDAGGGDYLIKPVSPGELLKKVKIASDQHKMFVALQAEKKMAFDTAMTAMSSTGELGVCLEFLRKSFTVEKQSELADLLIESMRSYSLECSVQLRLANEVLNFGSQGVVSPLAQELLSRLKDQGRIMEHGQRLILNFGAVSMLVNNMPLDNPDVCGRIRDNVAILMEGAESKLHELEIVQKDRAMKQQLQQLVVESNAALQDVDQLQQKQKAASVAIMDELLGKLERSFFQMGLTEEQEEMLLGLTRDGIEKSLQNQDSGAEVDAQLNKITQNLRRFSEM